MTFLSIQFFVNNGAIAFSTSSSLAAASRLTTTLASVPSLSPPFLSKVATPPAVIPCCSRVCHQVPTVASPELHSHHENDDVSINGSHEKPPITGQPDGDPGKEVLNENPSTSYGISGIQVPRPRYISISKARLLNAIISELFESQVEADQFLHLSRCLDSILLAEHKCILEEMRVDYDFTNSVDSEGTVYQGSSNQEKKSEPNVEKSYAVDSTEEYGVNRVDHKKPDLSAELAALLSTLSDNVKSPTKRRGHVTERQKGLLTVEKLDYLQSMLLQRIFILISRPLGKLGIWLSEQVLKRNKLIDDTKTWTENLKAWLKELPFFRQSYSSDIFASNNLLDVDHVTSDDLPIWLAAQRAVTRYEGILSTTGPRGRLLRKLLTWIGLAPSAPEQAIDFKSRTMDCDSKSYSGPISLSRITIADIWRPASLKHCGNDFWKMLKTAISILISQSALQEPAFKELILLYTKESDRTDTKDKASVPPLELKIYEKIPMPDLPVIFPHKKLSFRILDAVRLDAATILGLLAYFINYKFEDILSSPSAILLDVVAVSALVIYVFRVVLGYKQTRDRYQLLVNRTLYEKTVASGFGSIHFLLDASQQQQYKEAILAYAILLKGQKSQVASARTVGDECEKFIFDVFNEKIEMPIHKAKNTLMRLGLVTETAMEDENALQAIPCSRAAEILRQQWNSLLA